MARGIKAKRQTIGAYNRGHVYQQNKTKKKEEMKYNLQMNCLNY
jgi:hypothetical protein